MGQGKAEWLSTMEDPFRHQLLAAGEDLPEQMRACAAPVQGEPAHDPDLVAKLAAEIDLPTEASFEHPVLEQAVRIGLAHIDATFEGDHPKYGVGHYGQEEHDAFPPTIVAAVDALTLWGRVRRAEEVFSYWLRTFVRPDGTIDYYGPSLSEYGMVLTSAARLVARGGSPEWLDGNSPALGRIAAHLRELLRAEGGVSLLPGVPEADEREIIATYFHNNAWVARGLLDWAGVIEKTGAAEKAGRLRSDAARLTGLLAAAVSEAWPEDPADWWLRPTTEEQPRPDRITGTRLGSYTNYRYWPELLSSGMVAPEWCERIVEARLAGGGQLLGVTRFEDWLDDWPLADYLEGLWKLGRKDDFRLSLWGHIFYHQAEGHLTAYEQVTLPPGGRKADYCLPCQLVAARAAALMAGRN